MYIVAKTIKGKEYVYSNEYSILCKTEKQATELASFMNKHNDTTNGTFKLKDNELWYVYEVDKYDKIPRYKLTSTKNKISIKAYYNEDNLFYM